MIVSISFAQSKFKIERIGTDYNGVIENKGRIIAYGNYGVITFSDNFGETWTQINLGEFNHIFKIIKDEKENLYALCTNSILFSSDNGNNWKQRIIDSNITISDFAIKEKSIFLLVENKILVCENFNGIINLFLEFDEMTLLQKCLFVDKYLFVVDLNNLIFRIDIYTKNIDTIDISSKIDISPFTNIERVKEFGKEIYLVLKSPNSYSPRFIENYQHCVIKTKDFGNTWEILTRRLPVTFDFLVNNDSTISTLSPYLASGDYFGLSYSKIRKDSLSKHNQDTSQNVYFPYFSSYGTSVVFNYYFITGLTRCESNDSIIAAVGNNKVILVSKDNGKTWVLKSFFRPLYQPFLNRGKCYQVNFLGTDTIVVVTAAKPFFFISTDNGATFLPPDFKIVNEIANVSKYDMPVAFGNGYNLFGFFTLQSQQNIVYSDTLIAIYSTDLGKTFTKKTFPLGYTLFNDSIHPIINDFYYERSKNQIYLGIRIVKKDYYYTGPSILVCIFNQNFDLIDTLKLFDLNFKIYPSSLGLFLTNNWGLLNYNEKTKRLDSIAKFPESNSTNPSYEIMGFSKNYFFIQEISNNSNRLLKFNFETKDFELLDLFATRKYTKYYMFEYFDTTIIASQDYFYFFPDINNNLNSYFTFPSNIFISDSSLLVNQFGYPIKIFVSLEKVFGTEFLNTYYLVNFARYYQEKEYLKVAEELNKISDYLFSLPPFPNPASDFVYLKVFWDTIGEDKPLRIDIYDFLGRKINLPIDFLFTEFNSGQIYINTSSLLVGTYYIHLNYGNRHIVFPFSVAR